MIFYFSATGNSLCVAKKLEEKPISIPQILNKEALDFRDEKIGVVFPDYGSEPPRMVREFLKRANFETPYFYILMTYGCSSGASADIIRQITEKCGIRLDYFRTVKMVDNYLPGFDMQEEIRINKQVDEQLAKICKEIEERTRELEKTTDEDRQVYEGYLAFTKEHPEQSWKNITFYATEACIACGLCAKVCPAGCIQIENGKAVHDRTDCQICMACIHHCPQKAVRMSITEVNRSAALSSLSGDWKKTVNFHTRSDCS